MADKFTISIGFPIYHIDHKELADRLNAKTRCTRVKRLQELGVPIRGVGKNMYVSVVDIIEAFINLEQSQPGNNYKAKSKVASKYL